MLVPGTCPWVSESLITHILNLLNSTHITVISVSVFLDMLLSVPAPVLRSRVHLLSSCSLYSCVFSCSLMSLFQMSAHPVCLPSCTCDYLHHPNVLHLIVFPMCVYCLMSLCSLPVCHVPLCLVNQHFLASSLFYCNCMILGCFLAWPCCSLFVPLSDFILTTAFACHFCYLCLWITKILLTWPHSRVLIWSFFMACRSF